MVWYVDVAVNRILFWFGFGRIYSAKIDSVFGVLAIFSFGVSAEYSVSVSVRLLKIGCFGHHHDDMPKMERN